MPYQAGIAAGRLHSFYGSMIDGEKPVTWAIHLETVAVLPERTSPRQ